jgi:RimJ/RimL family protein N-acetyltransferase
MEHARSSAPRLLIERQPQLGGRLLLVGSHCDLMHYHATVPLAEAHLQCWMPGATWTETDMVTIETKRLILRQWTSSDIDAFTQYYADEDSARYVGGRKNPEQAWRHLALLIGHWHLKGFGYWAVEEKEHARFIGCVGLWQSPGWPELELGYWLIRAQQGKGYATEACLRCIDYAREFVRAPSLVSYIDPDNTPSIQLARRLGAKYEPAIMLAGYGSHSVYRHF